MIVDGQIDRATLMRHNLAEDDLLEELRLNDVETADEVKRACLERSGEVSVVKKE